MTMTIETALEIKAACAANDESAKCLEAFAHGGEPAEDVMERALDAANEVLDAAEMTIKASFQRDGQTVDCSQPEVLGEAHGTPYYTEAAAIAACDAAQEAVDESDLDPSTVCSVYRGRVQVYSAK